MHREAGNSSKSAIRVIIIFGIISLLGDMVYESARSANSQYFELIGINAAQVGLVFGIGEFLGYFLRLIAGILSDKSGKHWLFIFIGYGMLISVPLMGLTTNWSLLIVLILAERIGKSLRNPAKDTILSAVAENQVGTGFAFGLQEALDQVGAFAGPLIFTLVFYLSKNSEIAEYQRGYKVLLVPFIALMLFVTFAYLQTEREKLIPVIKQKQFQNESLRPTFWIYTAFTFFCTLGFLNFGIIGYHLKANRLLSDGNITLLYSVAMIIDAITAIIIGRAYDQMKKKIGTKTGGLAVLGAIPAITLLIPFFALSTSITMITLGMIIFGIVIGVHETIMRSAIADITPFNKRGTSYGIFNACYGLALLGGSALAGYLYNLNQLGTIKVFTCAVEIIALFLYMKMNQMVKRGY